MPMVSVVMPVYNVEKYIRASIESVLAQTYTDFELIIVDDGSPDHSPQICDEYASKNSQIKVIHKLNGGRSSARNAGVDQANGKYILFIDSDDTIEPDLLEKVIPVAEKENADVTIFGIRTVVMKDGKQVSEKDGSHKKQIFSTHNEIEENFVNLAEQSMWNHPVDKLFRKAIITDNGVRSNSFYDRVCEDTVFLLDLFPYVQKICVIEGCFYNYYIRDTQSVVMKFIPERYEKYYGRFCKTKELFDTFNESNKNEHYLYKLYCSFIIWAYEFMFHKDCKFSLLQRYGYMRKLFSISTETKEFKKKAALYIQNTNIFQNASGITKRVLLSILKNNYFEAWVYHTIGLLKYRAKKK